MDEADSSGRFERGFHLECLCSGRIGYDTQPFPRGFIIVACPPSDQIHDGIVTLVWG